MMNWEFVAITAVLAVILMVVVLFLTFIAYLITEMHTKRQIELHKAGMPTKGWR